MDDAEWVPLGFKPSHAVAAVRMRFIQLFPKTATSWSAEQEHKRAKSRRTGLTIASLRQALYDEELKGKIPAPVAGRTTPTSQGCELTTTASSTVTVAATRSSTSL
ncbi:hypothetical protein [Rhizobium leguminosarum]|uniref:hypothetical protein n=1 Tax=Rhizobium leguminosarum TaxID=384 RepID=UPI001F1779F5|nr:hypothetical protein [Rhizobium leguminosarum]UIK19387.1 hypothetical protein LZK79_10370 [Rhizobium leguminosarum]